MDDSDATATLQVHGSGALVLVVEDNLVSQRVVTAMLTKLGHAVEVANHGREAMECVRRRRPALVLMDCQMPVMDGFAATRAIREGEDDGSRLTIVAMTAFAMEGDRERCIAAGMDDYIAKPMTPDALAGLLDRWLAGAGVAPAIADEVDEAVSLTLLRELEDELGPEELGELLAVLRRQVPSTLAEMRGRLAAGDLHAFGRLAHGLCGAAGNLGAQRLSRQLRAVEEACRTPGATAPDEHAIAGLERSYAEADAFFRAQLRL